MVWLCQHLVFFYVNKYPGTYKHKIIDSALSDGESKINNIAGLVIQHNGENYNNYPTILLWLYQTINIITISPVIAV